MAAFSNKKIEIPVDRRTKLAVVSFSLMRRTVGILGLSIGLLMPTVAAIFSDCFVLQESISHYYYTIAGDMFVGLLSAVSFFLIAYPGEGKWEDLWTNIAGGCGLAVAFFPTSYAQVEMECVECSFHYEPWVSTVHLVAAGSFFIILGGVAFWQFPRVITINEDVHKRRSRNRFYKICAIVMWACIACLLPMALPFEWSKTYSHFLATNRIVFFAEVIALVAFGTSWLIKGIVLQRPNPNAKAEGVEDF